MIKMGGFEAIGHSPENEEGSSEVFTSQINERVNKWIDDAEEKKFDKEIGERIGEILEECTADLDTEIIQTKAETVSLDSVGKYIDSIGVKLRKVIEEEISDEEDKSKAESLLAGIKLDILDIFEKSKKEA